MQLAGIAGLHWATGRAAGHTSTQRLGHPLAVVGRINLLHKSWIKRAAPHPGAARGEAQVLEPDRRRFSRLTGRAPTPVVMVR
jgi:hypothetical protein